MSRKGSIKKRHLDPDPLYGKQLVAKLINRVMTQGKKPVAEKIVYGAFDIVVKKLKNDNIVSVFETAVSNVKPVVEVRARRIGGATYQVPTEVSEIRGTSLALRWLVVAAKKRGGRTMTEKLAEELMDAYNGRGGAATERENKRKMAEANKAFAHFRW